MDIETLAALVEQVKVIPLRPDDVIVVRVGRIVSDAMVEAIKQHLKPVFGDRKILVIDPSADVEIVRPEECPA